MRLPHLLTLAVAATTTLAAAPANAIVLIGNLPQTNDMSGVSVSSPFLKALAFTTPSSAFAVESVDVRLQNATNVGGVLVRLFATDAQGDAPATTEGALPLATFINPNFTTTAITTYNFTLATPFVLAPGTQYWLVVASTGANTFWRSSFPSVTPSSVVGFTHSGSGNSSDNGSSYRPSTVLNSYQLNGSAVAAAAPEPTSLTLIALVCGGAVVRRRRIVRRGEGNVIFPVGLVVVFADFGNG
jgi:hypothetical protein